MSAAVADGFRARLVGPAFVGGLFGGALGLLLLPVVLHLDRDVWHLGCEQTRLVDEGRGQWICPDGVAYAIPSFLWILAFTAAASVGVLGWRIRRSTPVEQLIVARDLVWFGAVPLVLQAPFSVWLLFGDRYSCPTGVWGVLVAALAVLALVTARRRSGAPLFACCVGLGVAAVGWSVAAVLVAPFAALFGAPVAAGGLVRLVRIAPPIRDGRHDGLL